MCHALMSVSKARIIDGSVQDRLGPRGPLGQRVTSADPWLHVREETPRLRLRAQLYLGSCAELGRRRRDQSADAVSDL